MRNSFFDASLDAAAIRQRVREVTTGKVGFYSVGLYPASLANNCAMQKPLDAMCQRYSKLRKRNVYLHHYTEYMDLADIDGAAASIEDLAAEYGRVDATRVPDTVPSIEPLGIR